MAIRNNVVGSAGSRKKTAGKTSISQDALSSMMDEVNSNSNEEEIDNARSKAKASISKGALTDQENEDPFIAEAVRKRQTQGSSFSPIAEPIQVGSITTPFLGTTPIFSGDGVLMRRDKALRGAANRAAKFTPPKEGEFDTAAQFLKNYGDIASTGMKGVIDGVFEEFEALGLTGPEIKEVLSNPLSAQTRKINEARRGFETLGKEIEHLDEVADELDKAESNLDIASAKGTKVILDEIRRGDTKYIEAAQKGELGDFLVQLNAKVSALAVMNRMKNNLKLDVNVEDATTFMSPGLSKKEFISRASKEMLTDKKLDAFMDLVDDKSIVEDYPDFRKDVKEILENDLGEKWQQIHERPQYNINNAPPKDVTRTPLSLLETATLQGNDSKQVIPANPDSPNQENGISAGSVATNRDGDMAVNGGMLYTTIINGVVTTVSKKNPIATRNQLIKYNKNEFGIGKTGFEVADVQGAFEDQGISAKLEGALGGGMSKEDKARITKLDYQISGLQGPDNAPFLLVAESTIRKGGLVLGNGKIATSIIQHKVDGSGKPIVNGFNYKTNNGEIGVSIPAKTWLKAKKGTGWFGDWIDAWKKEGRLQVGNESIWLKDGMLIESVDDLGERVYVIAGDDGIERVTKSGERLEFPAKSIEQQARSTMKRYDEIISNPSISTKPKDNTALTSGKFEVSVGGEVETEKTPPGGGVLAVDEVPLVADDAAYDALDIGDVYKDKDGIVRTKKTNRK